MATGRTMLRAVATVVATTLLCTGCGRGPTAPSPPQPPPNAAAYSQTTLSFASDPQHAVGRGRAVTVTLQNAFFLPQVGQEGRYLVITVTPNDPSLGAWSFAVLAPEGTTISPGTYQTGPVGPSPSTWGAHFFGDSRGCTQTGRLVIHAMAMDASPLGFPTLSHFRASFENRCSTSPDVLRAEIAVLADPWR